MKKIISILLVVVILITSFIIPVSAEEVKTEKPTTSVSNDDLTLMGTNSFGNMLSSKIQENTSEMTDNGSRISDIQIEGTTATVTFSAIEDCTILVGIFDETTDQLLASGKSEVTKDSNSIDITIETETMPEYFSIKAYMLNGINSPIAPEYNSALYTKAIQELKSKTIHDFGDSEILNLDESEETNFAVFKDGTVIIENQENYNVPELIDVENGKYVFSNANEQMISLKSGDAFSYTYSENDVLVAVVDTIEIDGTTITITESKAELEDVFEYVKIESNSKAEDFSVDNSVASEGVEPVNTFKSRSVDVDESASIMQRYRLSLNLSPSLDDSDSDNEKADSENDSSDKKNDEVEIEVSGTASVSLIFSANATLNVYLSGTYCYLKAGVNVTNEILGSFTGTGSAKAKIGTYTYIPVPGINLTFTPTFLFEVSVSLNASMTTTSYYGFSCSSDTGFQNESTNPSTESEMRINGVLNIGMSLSLGCNILSSDIAEAKVTVTGVLRVTATLLEGNSNQEDGSVKHSCKSCISGRIDFVLSLNADVSFLFNMFKFTWTIAEGKVKLTDWYWSFDYGEFGWSLCPHKKCKVTVQLTNNESPLANEKIYINGKYVGATNEDGTYLTYLPSGEYSLIANTYRKDFTIVDESIMLNIDISDNNSNNNDNDDGMSGSCGDNSYWQFNEENGSLIIYGTGDFYNSCVSRFRDKLESVVILDGITSIGKSDYGFLDCRKLKEIKIPDSVTSIGSQAFQGCYNLEKITIPNNVTTIRIATFSCCYNLKEITIPNSVTTIEWYAFNECTSLKEIIIPDSVTSIEYGAFNRCLDLVEVRMSDSVTNIEHQVFRFCTNLKNVKLSNNITEIKQQTFKGCTSLENIKIPDNVKSIGEQAFEDCESLSEITIPDSVTSIAHYTFNGCTSLVEVTIPDNTIIEGLAFPRCSNLLEINVSENNKNYTDIDGVLFSEDKSTLLEFPGGKSGHYSIPEGTKNIRRGAFFECTNLSGVTIPNSVTIIDWGTFLGCSNLVSVNLSNSITEIQDEAFAECSSLKEIIIPQSVTYIGVWAFCNCINLTNVIIMNDETVIGAGAFQGCPYTPVSAEPAAVSLASEKIENDLLTVTTSNITTETENDLSAVTAITTAKTLESLTAEVSDLVADSLYFVVVVKNGSNADLFSADNLLYFTQTESDSDGNILLSYIPRESCDAPVILTYRFYVNNIEHAEIVIDDLYYTGGEQTAEYTILFNGETLEQDVDFTVSGDLSVTDTGSYSITFTGKNDYQGSVTVYYVLVDAYLYGDADKDSQISVMDATTIQKYLVELETLYYDAVLLSDVDNSGNVNIKDVTIIRKYIAEFDTSLNQIGKFSTVLK